MPITVTDTPEFYQYTGLKLNLYACYGLLASSYCVYIHLCISVLPFVSSSTHKRQVTLLKVNKLVLKVTEVMTNEWGNLDSGQVFGCLKHDTTIKICIYLLVLNRWLQFIGLAWEDTPTECQSTVMDYLMHVANQKHGFSCLIERLLDRISCKVDQTLCQ